MIRNLLYSIFLHLVFAGLVYLSFNFSPAIEINPTSKIAISFVEKSGNSANTEIIQNPFPELPKELKNIKPPKAAPKPDVPKELPKTIKPKKKPKPKKTAQKSKKKKSSKKSKEKKSKPKFDNPKTKENTEKKGNKKPDAKQKKEDPKPQEKESASKDQQKDVQESSKKDKVDKIPQAQQKTATQPVFSQNSIENLNLLAREKFNLQNQITRCYKKAADDLGYEAKEKINVKIFIQKDGSVNLEKIIIKDYSRYEDKKEVDFIDAVNLVKEALKFCSPMRNLPEDKYDVWKEIDLEFGNS